ncbi:MAG: FapA family protein [Ruminococcus sp.]|nr:FapA family protein [Ruminococcus sp.]
MPEQNQNKPVDCVVKVDINNNNAVAAMNITPPQFGGRDLSVELIKEAIATAGVTYGIKEDNIEDAVKKSRFNTDIIVAAWTPATDGVDGTIKWKFDRETTSTPIEDEKGNVDYKNLGTVRNIYKNTVIAEITLPTDGTPGTDVRGSTLAPKPGKKAAYTVGTNTAVSEDGKRITATADGALVYKSNTFQVEHEVVIKTNIDFATGNIEFIGDVIVNGDIMEGFEVTSLSGNVLIKGGVYGGTVKAAKNITIKKGANHSKIECEGDFIVMFCEYSDIKCEGNLEATNLIICNVYCGGKLKIKGKSGGLVGGRYTIMDEVDVENIGSSHYPVTEVTLGNNAVLTNEKSELMKAIEKRNQEIHDLTLIIDFLNDKKKRDLKPLPAEKEEILGNAVRTRLIKSRDIQTMNKRIAEIDEILQNKQNLRINCKGTIYPKTKIVINTSRYEVANEWTRCSVFVGEDGEITFGQL